MSKEALKILEYIESNRYQCIDTGITPNSNTGFEIDFIWYESIPDDSTATSGYENYAFNVGDVNKTCRFSLDNYSTGRLRYASTNKSAYITANGQKFNLQRVDGIAISPNKTYLSNSDETKTFKLYFPAIPKNSTTIDFIESPDSDWKIYGIQLYDKQH